MRRVIIESPFHGKTQEELAANIKYVREACRDAALLHQEVPFASHLFFTQFLDDTNPEERQLGINMGYDFWEKADKIIFYVDKGMSPGMKDALARAVMEDKPFEKRYLYTEHEIKKYAPSQVRAQDRADAVGTSAVADALDRD